MTFPHITSFLISCGSLLIWLIGGSQVIGGSSEITAGLLVSFISYTGTFYGPVNFFANLNDSIERSAESNSDWSAFQGF